MADALTIVRARQCAIRREMDRRGILFKQVQFDSGLSESALRSYFPLEGGAEPNAIPVYALFALAAGAALPLDLLSLLMPAGVLLVPVPEDVDHDEASAAMHEYQATKSAAHRPCSPEGPAIAACEDAELRMHLAVVARKGGQ